VSDGIVRIHGLADVMQGEMIELPNSTYALALNLERDSVGAVVLGDYEHLREGDTAKTTGRILEVPIGRELLGRVVNALGEPIDGKGPIDAALAPVETSRPGRDLAQVGVAAGADRLQDRRRDDPDRPRPARADHRRPPDRQDRLAIDAIINQKGTGLKCVYVAIGQKASTVANVVRKLEENGALAHTIVVAATRPSRPRCSTSRLRRLHHGEYFSDPRRRRADHLRRSVQAGRRLPPDLAAAAPSAGSRATRATCSTCTAACSSAPRASPRSTSRSSPTAQSRQDRLADRAADHRNAGRRRVRRSCRPT
jgi:F-type H+-transporting ATPase subunit alpha